MITAPKHRARMTLEEVSQAVMTPRKQEAIEFIKDQPFYGPELWVWPFGSFGLRDLLRDHTPEDFKRHLHGEFKVDQRYVDLYERTTQYYDALRYADSADAERIITDYSNWCKINGYTSKEINDVKNNIQRRSDS